MPPMPRKRPETSPSKRRGVSKRSTTDVPDFDSRIAWVEFVFELRQKRVAKGITSRELADALGITLKVLSTWETGLYAPHPHDLMVWCRTLGVKLTTD